MYLQRPHLHAFSNASTLCGHSCYHLFLKGPLSLLCVTEFHVPGMQYADSATSASAEKVWPGRGYKGGAQAICKSLLTHCIKSGESHMPMVFP